MTIKSLFQKRELLYYKKLLKYFRYIFNDHFSLVLFFMIGAGGYAYSNYLETITSGSVQPLFFLLLAYYFFTTRSSVTLVVEEADEIFLLAKEEEFYPILKGAVIKSYLQSLIPLALLTFITFPIIVQVKEATVAEGILLFLGLASLKWLNLLVKIYPYFYQSNEDYQKYKIAMYLVTLITIYSMNFIIINITALVAVFFAVGGVILFLTGRIYFDHLLKWDTMINIEEARLHKLYRFIQIFMDVPHMETNIRRLSSMDKLLDWFSLRYPQAPYYYLIRTVIRNTEYSLLVLRLTVIGVFFLIVTNSYLFSVGLTLIFIYMLGFQLISLVKVIDTVPQFQFYPLTTKEKTKAALRLINQLLLLMTLFFTLSTIFNLGATGLTVFPIGALAAYIFSYFYVPTRLEE